MCEANNKILVLSAIEETKISTNQNNTYLTASKFIYKIKIVLVGLIKLELKKI